MKPPVDPARLTRRVILEKRETAADGQGGESVAFVDAAAMNVLIEPLEVSIVERGGIVMALTRHRVTMRHRADIAAGDRLRRNGRTMSVTAVLDASGEGRYLTLEAEEIAP